MGFSSGVGGFLKHIMATSIFTIGLAGCATLGIALPNEDQKDCDFFVHFKIRDFVEANHLCHEHNLVADDGSAIMGY